jgi:outer membrane protein assembly factor BamB
MKHIKHLYFDTFRTGLSAAVLVILMSASSFAEGGKTGGILQFPGNTKVQAKPVLPLPDAVNFPFFRGEGSRGIAAGSGFPTEWNGSDGKNIKWKVKVPLHGKSSPVIWGDKIFITGAAKGLLELYCFDKNTGNLLWKGSGRDFPGASPEEPESDMEAGMAVSTAAVTAKEVCAVFGNGNLVCYDHDGKFKWGKNLGVPESIYGFSSSLVIYGRLLLIQYDSEKKIAIYGLDLSTGEQVWQTMRKGRSVNSSPVLAEFDSRPQLLINGNPNVSSYDPDTGEELWSLPGVAGDVAPSLAVNSTTVFSTTDYYKLLALRPGKEGKTIWEDNMYTADVSSPVANDQMVVIATGYGDVACYDAAKGDTLWTRYFKNPFYASPIICDEKVWLLDRAGIMHIVDAAPRFRIVSSSPLGENSDCTPAFSEKRIYVRTMENLICIGED